MSTDYPYTVEYAKSARAGCKACKLNIEKDHVRLGIMIQSPHFDGRIPLWHHWACFWKKARVADISDVHGFDRLRWDDQEKIRNQISGGGGASSGGVSELIPAEPKATDYATEYSKTAAAKCKTCDQKIAKGEIRVGKKGAGFHHFKCFSEKTKSLNVKFPLNTIPGFNNLTEEDQKICLKLIKPLKRQASEQKPEGSADAKKIKEDPAEVEEKKKLKEQSEALWKIKDALQANFKSKEMAELLEANDQEIPVQSSIVERLADCMLFGALQPCKECNGGQLAYSTSQNAYTCTGSISAFTKCQFLTQDPPRKALVIPHEMKEEFPYLASFKFKLGRKRIFPTNRTGPKTSSEEVLAKALVNKKGKGKAKSMSSSSDDRFVSSAPSSTKMVIKGGSAVDPESGLTAVAHVYQDTKKNIYNAILNVTNVQDGKNSYYKLQLLEHDKQKKYWIFRAWGRVGTTIGGNKLEQFNSNLSEALENFKEVYFEKTGNEFKDRKNFVKYPGKFMPVDIDYGQDDDEKLSKHKIESGSKSKLHPAVQDFIKMIFDIQKMKETMKEFDLDLKKMPLGKLSKRQIQQAYAVLTDLQKVLQEAQPNKTQVLDCSNKFYTLIPHDFGVRKPTMLDSLELLKSKTEMLDSLLEIELAYSILKSEGDTGEEDPVDVHYKKLATDIEVLDKKAEDYKLIVEYVKNTHGSTHTMFSLQVEEVFKISRHGEDKRFEPSKKIGNHMLLWHGSRTSNFAGIMSQGLRIAPPEAPVTGYMFGKGIYFADMVSKSAGYCATTSSNNIGFLLLSDVALGSTYDLLAANSNLPAGMPADKHSVKGCGQTTPDPKGFKTMSDGVVVPMGKGVPSGIKGSLLYNEFIVYDIAQVNLKYLIKTKFNYKI